MAGRKKAVNYLSNENLLREIARSKERLRTSNVAITPTEALTPELVNMLRLLVHGVSTKYNWRNYSYLDDMCGDALFALSQNALKFNEEKTQNPFSYYTQIVWSSFLSALEKEKKVGRIRDALLEDQQMTPSFARQQENEDQQREPIQKEAIYRKTADDEVEELTLKQKLTAINEALKILSGTEIDMIDLETRFLGIFPASKGLNVFNIPEDAAKLFPEGTTWEIDTNVPPEYGVSALLKILSPRGTKLSKGLMKIDNSSLAMHLCRAALSLQKDNLGKIFTHFAARSLKYGGKIGDSTSYKSSDDATISAIESERKGRGRKPKVK